MKLGGFQHDTIANCAAMNNKHYVYLISDMRWYICRINSQKWVKGYMHFFLFFFLAILHGMWDLTSLTGIEPVTPCRGSMES